MAATIGGLRVDLQLNSAAFIRDIAKTNQAISSNTKAMQTSLTRLRTTANSVGAAFTGWLTIRAARRVINFLDQSIELAAKLDNELGRTARAFEEQGEVMKNAFKLGIAQGFMDALSGGAGNALNSTKTLAQAGLIVGKVFGAVAIVIVDIFTVVIPKAINATLGAINLAITGLNKVISTGQALDNLFGLNKDYGQIELINIPNIEGGAAAFFNLADAERLAADAAGLTSSAMDAQSRAVKAAGEEFSRMAELQRSLYDTIRTPMEQYEAQLARISAAQLNAADTAKLQGMAQMELANTWLGAASAVSGSLAALFKDNKAIAVATAVINTAEAITAALKNPPGPPFSFAYAAAAAAAGAAQIATILSSNPGGSSKAIKKPSGGAKTQKAVTETSTSSGGTKSGQAINITLVGESGFSREQVRTLIGQLNEAVGDGATIRTSG
jgi:hypothetical protein